MATPDQLRVRWGVLAAVIEQRAPACRPGWADLLDPGVAREEV